MLDKVVPGYYYRRMENGDICMSTCCNNTASEHAMCERLVIDDMVHWAKDYKASGLQGCHPLLSSCFFLHFFQFSFLIMFIVIVSCIN